jgi:hypothetical protein
VTTPDRYVFTSERGDKAFTQISMSKLLKRAGDAAGLEHFQMAMANKLFYGDNLAVLRESIATESVDLIYLGQCYVRQAEIVDAIHFSIVFAPLLRLHFGQSN